MSHNVIWFEFAGKIEFSNLRNQTPAWSLFIFRRRKTSKFLPSSTIGSAMEGEVGTHLKQISEATWNENVCANLFALFLCCFVFHVPFPNKGGGMLTFSLFPCQTEQNTWSMLLGMMRWTWRESDFSLFTVEAQELRNNRALLLSSRESLHGWWS